MRGFSKAKPPNAFAWFARFVADQRNNNGRPFRSVKAATHEAAIQWDKLSAEEKADWKQKARSERVRFRSDPELRTMTPKEFIGQACEISLNGMEGDTNFWSRHWALAEREKYANELDLLEKFDTLKRRRDRENIETFWNWKLAGRDDIFQQTFMFISVQSSSPVEADNYVPETLAIAQFSLKEGIEQYSEFCCSLVSEEQLSIARRGNASHCEHNVGDEDGCQARVSTKAVAKLIFQRTKDATSNESPVFFCLAEEFEVAYDALCYLKSRISKPTERLSVNNVATIEDLTQCLFKWLGNVEFPSKIGPLQEQFYFDTMMERADPRLVANLRCGAHESDTLTRCPLSVVRLAATKLKQWIDNGGIPTEDLPMIDRQLMRQGDWPEFSDHDGDVVAADDDSDADSTGEDRAVLQSTIDAKMAMGPQDRTIAWIASQNNNATPSITDNNTPLPVDEQPPPHENDDVVAVGDSGFGDDRKINNDNNKLITIDDNDNNVASPKMAADGSEHQEDIDPVRNIAGLDGEMKWQSKLPIGARGIGRGLHLVPEFTMTFNFVKSMLKQ